jgi:hypothetical protein
MRLSLKVKAVGYFDLMVKVSPKSQVSDVGPS